MSKKDIRANGIINFWDFPELYVYINDDFKTKILEEFSKIFKTISQSAEFLDKSNTTIRNLKKIAYRIKINHLIKISEKINKKDFDLGKIQRNIIWIGHKNSYGLINPKLPFDFNSREGARFLAAICNDGWISDGVYYSNSDPTLRKSVKRDALFVFGGDNNAVKEWIKKKDQYLSFPSVIRDSMILMTDFKGVKSINNPHIPEIIFRNKELMCGWIEQTIADEGYVKNFYRAHKEILWKRAFKKDLLEYRLHLDELKILDYIGIKYTIYNAGEYFDKNGILKTKKLLRISKRKNLTELRNLIKIPSKRKEDNFTKMIDSFVRYKERIIIKEKIKESYKKTGFITSQILQKEMRYKTINTAIKWLVNFEKEGILKCIEKSFYPKHGRRIPGKYIISKNF